jgi:hypothetical protein
MKPVSIRWVTPDSSPESIDMVNGLSHSGSQPGEEWVGYEGRCLPGIDPADRKELLRDATIWVLPEWGGGSARRING